MADVAEAALRDRDEAARVPRHRRRRVQQLARVDGVGGAEQRRRVDLDEREARAVVVCLCFACRVVNRS